MHFSLSRKSSKRCYFRKKISLKITFLFLFFAKINQNSSNVRSFFIFSSSCLSYYLSFRSSHLSVMLPVFCPVNLMSNRLFDTFCCSACLLCQLSSSWLQEHLLVNPSVCYAIVICCVTVGEPDCLSVLSVLNIPCTLYSPPLGLSGTPAPLSARYQS